MGEHDARDWQNLPIDKIKERVEFWRAAYTKLEAEHKQLGSELVNQPADVLALKDRIEKAEAKVEVLSGAVALLSELAEHVKGRDGMQNKSDLFCGICGSSYRCMMPKVIAFLNETDDGPDQ
jgi:tetrahydromethanopterin S-methyltransferase subunit G